MDEEEILDRITLFLEKGGTMLATHHDCGAPLFRFSGQVVCPVCSLPEQGEGQGPEKPDTKPKTAALYRESSGPNSTGRSATEPGTSSQAALLGDERMDPQPADGRSSEPILGSVRASLLARMDRLAEEMREEHDYDQLRRQLDCLGAALRALRILDKG